jgi:hypothetical protein
MSFDMMFYRFVGSGSKNEQMDQMRVTPASADEVAEIKRIASVISDHYPDSEIAAFSNGTEHGAVVTGDDIPDIEVSKREVFISFHPDPGDPEDLRFLRDLMKLLEHQGYEAFDPQKGEFVFGDTYEW